MYFLALAADYDGTIAQHGFVSPETCQALQRLKATGRRLLLVTGRELADLRHAFPQLAMFDRVVVENGAVLYDPATDQEQPLAPSPPAHFVEKLIERKVEPISVGRSIVATWEPHQNAILDVIRELGLEVQIVFNKGAVMVLPPGVNKATGLQAALRELDISPHNVVAVGDAENDHAFLKACGCAAAVANALPSIIDEADVRLAGDHGRGVIELVERIVRDDAEIVPPSRSGLLAGVDEEGSEIYLRAGRDVLIAGASSAGKSCFAKLLTERMVAQGVEFCVFDPEGDYEGLEGALPAGDRISPPVLDEALALLRPAQVNVVVNTLSLNLPERRRLFAELLPCLADLHPRTGRPHWLLVDEAHQVLPAPGDGLWRSLSDRLPGTIMITVDPQSLAADVLDSVDSVLAFGSTAPDILLDLAKRRGSEMAAAPSPPARGEALFWSAESGAEPRLIGIDAPRQAHRRHAGKYAAGEVGEGQSFYFRGSVDAAVGRAGNLMRFCELAAEVDDATWEHHLRAGDYSAWFRDVIKDASLAAEAAAVETDQGLGPGESRKLVIEAIKRRYIAPA